MRRREFIALLGGAATTWPLPVLAQQAGAKPVIGFVSSLSRKNWEGPLSAFLKGLSEVGFVDGRNVSIEYRWAEGQFDRLPDLAADLVNRQVSVIAATGTPAALAAKAATTTIPIVFETASDPIQIGLVTSLNRPGANVTGVTQLTVGLVPKEMELLRELFPKARVMALLVNPSDPAVAETESREVQSAASTLGLELNILNASSERDFDVAFENVARLRADALVIGTDGLFTSLSEQLAALAVRHAVPAVYKGRNFAAAGGLLSYGSDLADTYRLAGGYTGRVLKGDKPADLPVQQATKIELFINLKTAKALGLNVPLTLLGRADEIFE
jgi:putative ABC transport system substrate-binding protein